MGLESDVAEDDIENAIRQNAQGPASAEADGVKAAQHRLPEQIETDKYLAANGAMSKPWENGEAEKPSQTPRPHAARPRQQRPTTSGRWLS